MVSSTKVIPRLIINIKIVSKQNIFSKIIQNDLLNNQRFSSGVHIHCFTYLYLQVILIFVFFEVDYIHLLRIIK